MLDDEWVLIDHSRYGTWINDERVRGRQRLAAGDRVRVGDLGIELNLITVSDNDG
jgi:pSer/pThr/pTyr-binding forkhead associated (FHA) protein